MDYNQIVWIASYPKSGNTWVRMFLDAYFLQEVDINDIVCSVGDDNASRHLVGDQSNPIEYPIDIQMLTRPMALLRLVRAFMTNKQTGIPLFVKTHAPHVLANGIELLPHSLTKAVIYIVRNPYDVAPSFAKHMGVTVDKAIEAMDDKYKVLQGSEEQNKVGDLLGAWDAHVSSFINADSHNVMWVRYEDMLARPVEAFSRILRHSGIEPDEGRVKAALEMVEIDKLRKQEEKSGFIESSIHAKNQFFGKGGSANRSKLTDANKFMIRRKWGRVMKRLDYISRSKVAV